ncbi:MAG: cob(I)yrinic acid a,c-diamide adenosyltransferase [Thermodesulfobacteriota bacterium]|nr:cob(I)yrinic acid a,c-diamide adenosyltransferase [Thermodesulfobacteriota bacterium]
MDKGYIHLYTGDGKGKTTAALGLALRAAGHDRKVFIGQFMKGQYYGELTALQSIAGIDIEQFGDEGCLHKNQITEVHRNHARQGIDRILEVMAMDYYDMVIMDEICVTVWFDLLSPGDVLNVIEKKPVSLELVLTGRRAPKEFIEAADLVTEMKEVKHYYTTFGILARDGIER